MKVYMVTRYEKRPMIRLRGEWLSDALGIGIGDLLAVEARDGGLFLREVTDAEHLAWQTAKAERAAKLANDRVRSLRTMATATAARTVRVTRVVENPAQASA